MTAPPGTSRYWAATHISVANRKLTHPYQAEFMNRRPCGSAADALRFISANYVENYSAKIESRKELTVAADDAVTGLSAPDG
jgi:hypothetical protein